MSHFTSSRSPHRVSHGLALAGTIISYAWFGLLFVGLAVAALE